MFFALPANAMDTGRAGYLKRKGRVLFPAHGCR
jgi:hypothetical protein